MIEGSLKFHSEKMSFEKSKTRYPKTRLSCSHYQESEDFSRDKEYDPNTAFISGWEVSSLEELQALSNASLKTVRVVGRQAPDPDESVGWGWNWSSINENVQETSKSFINRNECLRRSQVFTDHILYQLLWLLCATIFPFKDAYILRAYENK